MRNNWERKTMKRSLIITSLFSCMIATVSCAQFNRGNPYNSAQTDGAYYTQAPQCQDGVCTSDREFTAVCTENVDGYSECSDNSNVNYTRTAAQFRDYGERSPRDHRISQAAAGNNVSAAIPPSIDDEVLDYEAELAGGNVQYDTNGMSTTSDNSQAQAAEADNPNKDWLAEEGQSLKELLTQWSDESGWRLIWKTNRNYTLNAGAMFRGNFADVASALVRAFARARPAPVATFYKGNRVLVIETMEDENAYD